MTSNLSFTIKSGWNSFWRNAPVSLASTFTVFLIFLLLGVSAIAGTSFLQVLNSYQRQVSFISINIADNTPLKQVYIFAGALQKRPYVTSVWYSSKRQELQIFEQNPADKVVATQIQGNPIAARLYVKVSSINKLPRINELATHWPWADSLLPTDFQANIVHRMGILDYWVKVIESIIALILAVICVLVVMNTIRTTLYVRRREIEIMRLVGASEYMVRLPFVVEGIITGLMGSIFAIGVIFATYQPLVHLLHANLFFVPIVYNAQFELWLELGLLSSGVFFGAIGSMIGIRRYVSI